MFDFVANFNFNLGPLHVDLGKKKSREDFGRLLLIAGIILVVLTSFPASAKYINAVSVIGDLVLTFGIVLFLAGAFLNAK